MNALVGSSQRFFPMLKDYVSTTITILRAFQGVPTSRQPSLSKFFIIEVLNLKKKSVHSKRCVSLSLYHVIPTVAINISNGDICKNVLLNFIFVCWLKMCLKADRQMAHLS